MIISTWEILAIREAISSTALENGWDKKTELEMFNKTVNDIVEFRVKADRKKRRDEKKSLDI